MGTNMYPSSSLLGQEKDAAIASLPVDELIEKVDGFAGVFPGTFTLLLPKKMSISLIVPILSQPCNVLDSSISSLALIHDLFPI